MKLQRIKNLRENYDLTQTELARILNISQRTLSHYESGTRDIPVDILIKTADYFRCSTDYLLERTSQKEMLK
ncbi:MAG: helix-turn-helix domain-containing protein [Lachnospiraceae bacterium]